MEKELSDICLNENGDFIESPLDKDLTEIKRTAKSQIEVLHDAKRVIDSIEENYKLMKKVWSDLAVGLGGSTIAFLSTEDMDNGFEYSPYIILALMGIKMIYDSYKNKNTYVKNIQEINNFNNTLI